MAQIEEKEAIEASVVGEVGQDGGKDWWGVQGYFGEDLSF